MCVILITPEDKEAMISRGQEGGGAWEGLGGENGKGKNDIIKF